MAELSDEQVAEERTLGLARAWAKVGGEHNADTTCRIARLALALHERLQAAKAERDEARKERDVAVEIGGDATRMLNQMQADWSKAEAIWKQGRQQARREAFEEVDERVRLLPVPASSIGYRDAVMLTIRALSEVER
jgi:hypothetical protein